MPQVMPLSTQSGLLSEFEMEGKQPLSGSTDESLCIYSDQRVTIRGWVNQ